MSQTLQAVIGICVGLLTVLKAATMLGWRAGTSDHAVAALAADVLLLRAWRHKIGDDPCDALGKIQALQHDEMARWLRKLDEETDRRLTKLETKVFNGAKP